MKEDEFLKRLHEKLQSFVLHSLLLPELLKPLKRSGREKSFLSVLLARLEFLNERGIQATVHQEFEPIEQGIYSMHLAGEGFNIRILYGFLSNGRPALLMAFYERGGHRATDYTGKVPTAVTRLKEIEEELL